VFVLLNGAFGIGKTTVAETLAGRLADVAIYDPERVGFVLRRLPPWLVGRRKQPDDYQDLGLWRHLIVHGARAAHRRAALVIVPMAFSDLVYFNALADGLGKDARVEKICLVAPPGVVVARLRGRAAAEDREVSDWELRRAEECCWEHRSPSFGQPVDASRPPPEIVADILAIIAAGCSDRSS